MVDAIPMEEKFMGMALPQISKNIMKILCAVLLLFLIGCSDPQHAINKQAFTYVHPMSDQPTGIVSGNVGDAPNIPGFLIMNQIYETLFYYDNKFSLKPLLVKGWDVSEDGRLYRFQLKQAVYFHDNSELESYDVVYSLKKALELGRDIKTVVRSINECGKYCFEIVLNKPYPKLLSLLADIVFEIYPRDSLGEGKVPAGTGPYYIASHDSTCFILNWFEKYRDKKNGNFTEVQFEAMAKKEALQLYAERKNDDLFEYVLTDEELNRFSGKKVKVPSFVIYYIGMNTKIRPFDNIWFRRAIQYALDKEALYKNNYSDQIQVSGFLPAGLSSSDLENNEAHFQYSEEKARQCLKLAGVSTPIAIDFWVREKEWNSGFIKDVSEQLQKIGIIVRPIRSGFKEFYDSYFSKKQQMFFIMVGADLPDAGMMLSAFQTGDISNDIQMSNKTYDAELERLSFVTNKLERSKLVRKIEDILIDEAAVVPVFQQRFSSIYQDDIWGYGDLSYMWYSKVKMAELKRDKK